MARWRRGVSTDASPTGSSEARGGCSSADAPTLHEVRQPLSRRAWCVSRPTHRPCWALRREGGSLTRSQPRRLGAGSLERIVWRGAGPPPLLNSRAPIVRRLAEHFANLRPPPDLLPAPPPAPTGRRSAKLRRQVRPIARTLDGLDVGLTLVWTITAPDWTTLGADDEDCEDWTTLDPIMGSYVGVSTSTDAFWTALDEITECSYGGQLDCFENKAC